MTITYILLVTSICLDVTTTIMLVFSDLMVISLLIVNKLSNKSRNYWLIEMPQLNILNNFLKIFAPNEALHRIIINWIIEKAKIKA
ncbi:hypothetical protein IEQ34_001173 [Dendrobium chrysotoxum]|uniref:Uncharacterized protein n=1 Tax=Dendrobium chrysotoxum TaxID=161865 RepID=A0AAV7HNA2_DENCH|nr:hypothetical protein IEQ34_001173 [Dendrobium chrysotoxum]